jgi:TetR/AcrR family transcriptional repressor of nem operon
LTDSCHMTRPKTLEKQSATTARGAATRTRIIDAASRLVAEKGVAGTRLDDIMTDSDTSKSQIYHYFSDRETLMCAVVEAQADRVLNFQKSCLDQVESIADLRTWRDKVIEINRLKRSVGGCPVGSLASELADRSETARDALVRSFGQWESYLIGALERMRQKGNLSPAADIPQLATGILAALQGGLLMAQTMRTTRPLQVALDMALEQVSRQTMVDTKPGHPPKPKRSRR